MILFIDTTDFSSVTFTLKNGKRQSGTFRIDSHESHKLLETLEKFLKTKKVSPGTIGKIIVCSGPGSYTGVRVGMAQAQGLGEGWGVPVTALKKETFLRQLGK